LWGKKNNKRSPLKERPLRLPGQSVEEEIEDLLTDELLYFVMFATVFVILTLYDWYFAILNLPRNPLATTAITGVVIAYCAFRIYRVFKKIEPLKLGRDGERIVAEQLDVLKQQGAVIFHDVVADGFNLDHVIFSKFGIFVVETKTRSKPITDSKDSIVTYDGNVLLVDGFKPDRDPVAQSQMNARWLANELQKSTGKTFAVKPVVLFPGWFVKSSIRDSTVWVLEPKAFPKFVQNETEKLSDADLHLAVYHMNRMVRPAPR
jgi:Nuclease-related domain